MTLPCWCIVLNGVNVFACPDHRKPERPEKMGRLLKFPENPPFKGEVGYVQLNYAVKVRREELDQRETDLLLMAEECCGNPDHTCDPTDQEGP